MSDLDPRYRLRHLREPSWRQDCALIAALLLIGLIDCFFLPAPLLCLYWVVAAVIAGATFWDWALYGQLQAALRASAREANE